MAKARKKSGKSNASRASGVAKKLEEIRKIRNQVRNLIFDNSVDMAKRIVRSVSEEGSVSALKFLWEAANIFPSGSVQDESAGEETLAKMILQALELPTEPPKDDREFDKEGYDEEETEEADVESEEVGDPVVV